MSSLVVKVCRIDEVIPHPNADKLEILRILGWNVVEKKDRFKVGDTVVYFEPNCILPRELSDKLNCTQYLSNQRLKAAKLRGIVSCGLVAPNEDNWPLDTDLTEYYGITKYEPPEPKVSGLGGQNIREYGPFHYYTKIENWNNYPDVFVPGEEVVITHKIHGTSSRFGLVDDQFYVGSHFKNKARDENIVYWKIALRYNIEERMREIFPKGYNFVIFSEIFGAVQDLRYGLDKEIDFRVFDITRNEEYLDYNEFMCFVEKLNLPTVPILHHGPYDAKLLEKLAEGKPFRGDHVGEGAVIRPIKERWHPKLRRVILKKINPEYLVRKGNTTEYH